MRNYLTSFLPIATKLGAFLKDPKFSESKAEAYENIAALDIVLEATLPILREWHASKEKPFPVNEYGVSLILVSIRSVVDETIGRGDRADSKKLAVLAKESTFLTLLFQVKASLHLKPRLRSPSRLGSDESSSSIDSLIELLVVKRASKGKIIDYFTSTEGVITPDGRI